jgi:hypothetical protein
MSGEHTKREMVTGEKPEGSGTGRKKEERTPSKETGDKHREEFVSSIKSHRKGDEKKKKRWPTTRSTLHHLPHLASSLQLRSAKSASSIVRYLYAILVFQNALLYFRYP